MKLNLLKGTTSFVCHIFVQDSSSTVGAGLTGLTNASAGLVCYWMRPDKTASTASTINAITTLGTYAGSATNCAFKEVDSTNMPGVYEFQAANNMLATGANQVVIILRGATNMAPVVIEIQLTSYDPNDTVRLGLTSLPNVASGSAGAIPTTGTGANQINVDGAGNAFANVNKWLAGTIPAPNVTGVPKVDVVDWLGGTIPAVNVTGVPKVDIVDWLGTAPNALNAGRVDALTSIRSNTAQAGGSTTTIVLDAGASATNGFYNDCLILTTGGTGPNQARSVLSYVGSTKTATIYPAWNTTPDATTTFTIVPEGQVDVGAILASASVGAAGYVGIDWGQITNKTTTNALTGTTIAITQQVDLNTIKTQTVTCAAGVTVGAFVGNATAALSVDASGRIDVGKILGTASAGAVGYVGIDWSHINAPTTAVALTGTTIGTLTTYTGNTPQTGDCFVRLGAPAGASVSADIAEIEGETDTLLTGVIVTTNNDKTGYGLSVTETSILRTGTAQAGAAGSITLDAGASAIDNFYLDTQIDITAGPGVGQSRVCSGYTGSTQVATITPNWKTNPTNASTFVVRYRSQVDVATVNDKTGYSLSVSPPTTAQIATGVWQDTTAGDFTVAGSIGKSLFTSGNAPGAASGLLIAGSNAATTFVTLTSTGAFSINGVSNVAQTGDSFARLGAPAGASIAADLAEIEGETDSILSSLVTPPTTAQIATAIWQDLLASADFGTAASIGALLKADIVAPPANWGALLISVGGHISNVDTLTTYTGNTLQTGDSFARLGAPAGASVSADIAEIEGETDGIAAIPTNPFLASSAPANFSSLLISVTGHISNVDTLTTYTGNTVQTGDSFARLGAPAGASVSADIAEIEAETDGIAAIPTSNPSAASIATTVWQDLLASADFGIAASIGLLLKTNINATISSSATVAGYASGQDPATLVLDVAASLHNIAGTIGHDINSAALAGDPWPIILPGAYPPSSAGNILGNLAGGLTPGEEAAIAAAVVASPVTSSASGTVGGQLNKIGTGRITTVSPVAQDGAVSLVQGDSYLAILGRALLWTDSNAQTSWPDLTEAIITLEVADGVMVVVGKATIPTGSAKQVMVEPLGTDTQKLVSGTYNYNVVATYTGTGTGTNAFDRFAGRVTLATGQLIMSPREDQP